MIEQATSIYRNARTAPPQDVAVAGLCCP